MNVMEAYHKQEQKLMDTAQSLKEQSVGDAVSKFGDFMGSSLRWVVDFMLGPYWNIFDTWSQKGIFGIGSEPLNLFRAGFNVIAVLFVGFALLDIAVVGGTTLTIGLVLSSPGLLFAGFIALCGLGIASVIAGIALLVVFGITASTWGFWQFTRVIATLFTNLTDFRSDFVSGKTMHDKLET
mmetsp:Transcript_11500/g.19707  ORF Transcript_11500/g.19707 Transcript_11500/m.19707 type:complete len:182 (-) Transcript_11500:208-753(-)